MFGESKRAVKAAMDRLEELGIILREFRDLEFSTGGVATNVMYVHLNVQRLREVTTEITSENAIPIKSNPIQSKKKNDRSSSDGMDMDKTICNLREEIRNRVQYDALSTDNRFDKEILDEIIEIMIEVYVMRADVKVSGKVIPYQLVRHRLDCYDQMLMEYVLFSLQDNPSKVGNIKQYLLATIINAPATESNYYRNQVNHDFL